MEKLSIKASTILGVATQALVKVMESRTARDITMKDDTSKLNVAFSNKLSSVIKTIAALQRVGTSSSQIATDGGGISDVSDYRGPANLMKLASINRLYTTNVAILRAVPMMVVEWVDDVEGRILSAREFNLIWDDFNASQSSRKLTIGAFNAEDLCISNFSAAYAGGEFVRLDGQLDACITQLLGIVVPGDAESYATASVPSDEEVQLWLIGTGSLTKTEE